MKNRDKIIFCFPDSLKEKERKWLQEQPELQLLGDFVFLPVKWADEVTGTEYEWKSVAKNIYQLAHDATGVVIWSPEQSLLSLAGYLEMSFSHLSIPIVLFSAPTPSKLTAKRFLQLGLKSVLINASYLALSDIAEVVVLAGTNVYRPSYCHWQYKNGVKEVVSVKEPLASLQFQLQIHGSYNHRSQKQSTLKQIGSLSTDIDFLQWYPGLATNQEKNQSQSISMIQTEEAFWEGQGLQDLRNNLLDQGKTVIWYSQNNWSKKQVGKQEYFLSHPQEWWAILVAQFAFALENRPQKAFAFIEKKIV